MEQINLSKGYGKLNPSEDQTTQRQPKTPIPKRRILVAASLLILLSFIFGALIGALVHKSTTKPPPSSNPNSPESLKTVCSVTRYPDSCFATITSLNITTNFDPETVFNLSLLVAVNELRNVSSLPSILISKSNDTRSESALRDCVNLFDDAVSQLNASVSSMNVGTGGKALMESKISDLSTWISGAMTDQETCLDGLEEMGSTAVDEVRAKLQNSREYLSNSLAILANVHSLLDKFGIQMH